MYLLHSEILLMQKMKYSVIIVDDEPKLQEVLRIKLERFCPEIICLGQASNAWDAFELITETQPDIVFLDIAMPKESGFDLLQRFATISFEIIFATGFDQYALDALKMSAVDYLLKPINTEELKLAVKKAIQQIEHRKKVKRYDVLKHNLQQTELQKSKVSIPNNNSHEFVQVSDIIRCEGWQKYTKLYIKSGSCLLSSYNIGIYKNMLKKYGFYSVHKSHLINPEHIHSFNRNGLLIMSDKSEVPVSRRKREAFYQFFIRKEL